MITIAKIRFFIENRWFNTYLDPKKHIFHEIYSICVHNYWKKSKNAKLIPWLDMKILKKSKNAKLIPWLDMKIVKKSKNPKLIPWLDMKLVKKSQIPKLIPWPDMTLLNLIFFGVQLPIKISISVNFVNSRFFARLPLGAQITWYLIESCS